MATQKKTMLVSTRKGLAVYHLNGNSWKYDKMHFEGIPVTLAQKDSRNGTLWAMLNHGHWGVKLNRSFDNGQTWEEITPPKYPEGCEIKEGVPATVEYLWAFSDGGPKYPDRIWLGSVPGGLFKSEDNGNSFELVESLWNHPSRADHWFGGGFDHPGIHSITVNPENNDHLYIGISVAGVFESKDSGKTWEGRNKGLKADFLPNPDAEYGQDPHLLVQNPNHPQVLWQQNHCGIFKTNNGGLSWDDVSENDGPAVFGFAIANNAENPDQTWVVPAVSDEIRIAKGHSLCVCRTDDGGRTWTDFRKGLPQSACFDIVYRHSLDQTGQYVAFGTTTGNLFLSSDYGESWQALNHYFPMIHAVRFV